MLTKIVISVAVMAITGIMAGRAHRRSAKQEANLEYNVPAKQLEEVAMIPERALTPVVELSVALLIVVAYSAPLSLPLLILHKGFRTAVALAAYVAVSGSILTSIHRKARYIASM